MSFKAFVWAWDQPVENATHQHILLALADIAPARQVKASAAYIAARTRRSVRAVGLALTALEAGGIISVEPRPGKTDLITLNIPADFMVRMDDDPEDVAPRGRPKKPPQDLKTPATSAENLRSNSGKPPPNPADEPKTEPEDRTFIDLRSQGADTTPEPVVDTRTDIRKAFDAYNDLAALIPTAQAAKLLSPARRSALSARMKEAGGLDGWLAALESVKGSGFLCGIKPGRDGPFSISLDFLLQPQSFTRLLEGFYHRDRSNGSNSDLARLGGHDAATARNDHRNSSMLEGARAALNRHR